MRFLATLGWCSVASKRSYKIRLELANLRASSSISDSVTDPFHCRSPMITADILDLAYQWLTPSRISWSWRDRQGHQAGDATSWAVSSRPVQMHGQFQECLSLLGNQAAVSAIPA